MPSAPVEPDAEPLSSTPFPALSPAARTAWAKHDRKTDGWLPLWRHMADSAAIAGQLWDEWIPNNVKNLIAETLPQGAEDARRLIVFLAASHDTGKATPAFACQVDSLADRMRAVGLHMRSAKEYGQDRKLAPHGLAGQLLLQEWMSERHGLDTRVSGQFSVIAGGHHGTPPEHQQMQDLRMRPWLLRHPGESESVWRDLQYELMDGCAELADVTHRFTAWRHVRLPQPLQVLLTALVILADWIASAPELFPYDPDTWLPAGPTGEARRLKAAWRGLDLPRPWTPEEPAEPAEELVAKRFALPQGASPRPVQTEAVRMARRMSPAGLLMIEAPMGEGKTEAALTAAEILAARTGAGGCLIALPTRATGDAMFLRVLEWLHHLPLDGPRSVVLAHAKAALNDVWDGLVRTRHRAIAAVDQDGTERIEAKLGPGRTSPTGLHAHQWLRGRKKQLLASFAVGTVDQVLFAGLKSRHLALRHLAVAGKVVVIDEVHAYDAYMNRYLDRVLEWLAAYQVPVVLLSATLPADRRRALAQAYAGPEASLDGVADDSYPLITAVSPGSPALTAHPAPAAGRRTEVALERLDDDLGLLADRLEAELADGGCALVVRNTVNRALQAADALRERFGEQAVTIAHSRFLAADRAARDAKLRKVFGPQGDRPVEPHIVVATQVIEQSLDIDFDLLVTDLAPADLVLQRLGRLHRHPRQRPPRLSRARCLVTGVKDWRTAPVQPVEASCVVYGGSARRGTYALWRSLAVLTPYLDGKPLVLPDHISPVVQDAYRDEKAHAVPPAWAEAWEASRAEHDRLLADKRKNAASFLLGPVRRAGRPIYGWLGAGTGDTDDTSAGRAQVRDSKDSLEVLVIQRQRDGRLTTVPWLDKGRGALELPLDFPPDRRAAEAVAASALTLPGEFCHPGIIERTIEELERFMVPAWQVRECPWLAGELFLVLDENCQTSLAGFVLSYSEDDGLRVAPSGVPTQTVTGAAPPSEAGPRTGEDEDGEETDAREQERADAAATANPAEPHRDEDALMTSLALSSRQPTAVPAPKTTFDLTTSPWLPVQRLDGTVEEVSLCELFQQAHELRRLVGDLPTQDFALLRLLLAILYDALDGRPRDLEEWGELWQSKNPFDTVPGYLGSYRGHFDLLHPERPFFQVADLHTERGEVASLNRIVADVPNGDPFFAMRRPGVDRLTYAEAARWVVHAHAYDPSGIKSGMVGDSRKKAGKVYPQGVGVLGTLGGIFAEGANLRQTLLLNLIALDEDIVETPEGRPSAQGDAPSWRRPPYGAGPADETPTGLRHLYTWQARRIRLHVEDGAVTGVVLGYGDPLALATPWKAEPMSGWRRSPAQEKKQGRPLVYMPKQHDPSRAAWRGLEALLPERRSETDDQRGGKPSLTLPSGVASWLAMLTEEGELEPFAPLRLRTVGVVYGTQQSVVDEVVDDAVVLPAITLHRDEPLFRATAVDAVHDADKAVKALGDLAGNLARATGSDPAPATAGARDLGFGDLDGPFRRWLMDLAGPSDLRTARAQWQLTVRRRLLRLRRTLLDSVGPAASEGRIVDVPGIGKRWVNDAQADLWFRRRLHKVLPLAEQR
ncbi:MULTISPECIES: type I-E CRISPR-associated protein Cse1/CasA [Streptomyces]|uniref:type I-E CRISPR-associated protein Cse1/CasA n=1 Tax=Streptomyces TaxID=1883 RepID=UPI00163C9026|nr:MULTISPECIES: type I-E CRISPR-associated protein Cse1/CasA [Streptomyces]MBC2876980.1 type I-E CRISPR-associated protein Cse1/CasA [Streptomyces sp. TYQ1024]UBI36005.1 type I-E CRISPR-associated protein Cse1/CasA [Streptomyces mobaraensis]UKW28598.1 type I-E CRISPR-associated protein Cse1/CasA [Streptomyces sp. TYQ1024]